MNVYEETPEMRGATTAAEWVAAARHAGIVGWLRIPDRFVVRRTCDEGTVVNWGRIDAVFWAQGVLKEQS